MLRYNLMCLIPTPYIILCGIITFQSGLIRTSTGRMGSALSSFFQSGSNLLPGNHRGMSEHSKQIVRTVFHALRANPRVTVQRLEGLLCQIPKV